MEVVLFFGGSLFLFSVIVQILLHFLSQHSPSKSLDLPMEERLLLLSTQDQLTPLSSPFMMGTL